MAHERVVGTFGTQNDIQYFGELNKDGFNSSLDIYGKNIEGIGKLKTIYGIGQRMERITCVGCSLKGIVRSMGVEGLGQKAEIFPKYVLSGQRFFESEGECVDEVIFKISDINGIFENESMLSTIFDARPILEKLKEVEADEDIAYIGDGAILSYFSGNRISFNCEISLGIIEVVNVPSFSSRRPFTMDMLISMKFASSISLQEAINRLLSLRHFMSVIAGRAQGISMLRVKVKSDEPGVKEFKNWLDVAWSLPPMESDYVHRVRLGSFDLPLHAVNNLDEFSKVCISWFSEYEKMRTARYRFIECMEYGNLYNVARLVTAANMFDTLPPERVPISKALSQNVIDAASQAKAIFKKLDESIERSSMLTAIGLLGKPSLPKKVAHRSEVMRSHLGHLFPEIDQVLKIAVKTRNHFVHGSPFDYGSVSDYLAFMTDALEFVFVVSDLIECGWHANTWSHKPKTANHPFSRFLVTYRDEIDGFLAASSEL